MTESEDPQYRAELITFTSKECYVYRPPPASSIGHRAEFWDVDHWLQVSNSRSLWVACHFEYSLLEL